MKKNSLSHWGVTDEMDSEIRRVVVLSNGVYLTVVILISFYFLVFLPFRPVFRGFASWVPVIVLCVGIGSLLLNRFHLYTFSKSIFIVAWILFITVLPSVLIGTNNYSYILHPFYCIISSIMVHLLFSFYRERVAYIFFLVITWALIVTSVDFITYLKVENDTSPSFFANGFFKWRVMTFMFAAFFNMTMIYVLRINQQFYLTLQRRNETISEQNKELEEQRKSLQSLANQLKHKVATDAHKLKKQDEQLTEYTFFNSHILRAPVSRIRGLLNLLSHKPNLEEETRIRGLLSENMNELDQAIKSINDKLSEGEHKE